MPSYHNIAFHIFHLCVFGCSSVHNRAGTLHIPSASNIKIVFYTRQTCISIFRHEDMKWLKRIGALAEKRCKKMLALSMVKWAVNSSMYRQCAEIQRVRSYSNESIESDAKLYRYWIVDFMAEISSRDVAHSDCCQWCASVYVSMWIFYASVCYTHDFPDWHDGFTLRVIYVTMSIEYLRIDEFPIIIFMSIMSENWQ